MTLTEKLRVYDKEWKQRNEMNANHNKYTDATKRKLKDLYHSQYLKKRSELRELELVLEDMNSGLYQWIVWIY